MELMISVDMWVLADDEENCPVAVIVRSQTTASAVTVTSALSPGPSVTESLLSEPVQPPLSESA